MPKEAQQQLPGLFWQGFVRGNQTLAEEILIKEIELLCVEDEIQEIRQLLDED